MTDIKKYRWLIVTMIVYYSVFFGTGRLIEAGGSASYILALSAAVISAVLYTVLFCKKVSDGLVLRQMSTDIRMVIGIILLISALVQATAVCSYSVKAITEVFMKKSPFPYILIFVLFPTLFGAYFGIKSVSRYAFIGGSCLLVLIGLILAFACGDYSMKNMYPLAGKGFPGFGNIVNAVFMFSNILYLFLLNSGRTDVVDIRKEIWRIVLISGTVFAAICLVSNLTVPFEALVHRSDPLLYVASTVDFSFLVERSEALVFLIWIFMSFLCLSALMCFVCSIAADTFCLSNRKAIIGTVTLIVAGGALLTDKGGTADSLLAFSLLWTGCVSVIIPVVLRVVYAFRKEQS